MLYCLPNSVTFNPISKNNCFLRNIHEAYVTDRRTSCQEQQHRDTWFSSPWSLNRTLLNSILKFWYFEILVHPDLAHFRTDLVFLIFLMVLSFDVDGLYMYTYKVLSCAQSWHFLRCKLLIRRQRVFKSLPWSFTWRILMYLHPPCSMEQY